MSKFMSSVKEKMLVHFCFHRNFSLTRYEMWEIFHFVAPEYSNEDLHTYLLRVPGSLSVVKDVLVVSVNIIHW